MVQLRSGADIGPEGKRTDGGVKNTIVRVGTLEGTTNDDRSSDHRSDGGRETLFAAIYDVDTSTRIATSSRWCEPAGPDQLMLR
ncbi:MAG: hypothetical protein JWP01_3923 [Myxococcales bacterium]|nr:hypothetical protein [Myxococcales bacterium]